jgi:hypothetical protein
MKIRFVKRSLSIIVVLATIIQAQAADPAMRPANEIRFGPSLGFNIEAKFRGFKPATLPAGPEGGPGVDRNYLDGYVRVDSSGNAEGETWYWGYQNTSQYDPGASEMSFHGLGMLSEKSPWRTDNPNYGIEVSYLRRVLTWDKLDLLVEFSAGYNRLEIDDFSDHAVNVQVTTDTFSLGGVIPPAAGYKGTFAGPGALLGATPARQTETMPGSLTGARTVDADIWNFRLGPVASMSLGETARVELAGGVASAVVDNSFRFSEILSAGGASIWRSGGGSDTTALFGPYVRGALVLPLAPSWSAFAGVQYQHMTEVLEQSADGKTLQLNFNNVIYVTAGLGFSF